MLGALLSVALLVSGCVIDGSPRPVTPDFTGLDLGGYSGEPLTMPAETGESRGRMVESIRMFDVAVAPSAIDSALRYYSVFPVPTPNQAVGVLAAATRATLTANGMLAGMSFGGHDNPTGWPQLGVSRAMRITVLRMRDDSAARAAARAVDADDFAVSPENVAVTIPGYADARGHWRPRVPTVAATLAHGPYVVTVLSIQPTTDLVALTAPIQAAFDAVLPKLDTFTPTPADGIAELPLDRDDMLARTLPAAPGQWPYPSLYQDNRNSLAGWGGARFVTGVVYGPVVGTTWFNEPGDSEILPIERVAYVGFTYAARFPDAATARRALAKRSGPVTGRNPVAAPGHIPDATCFETPDVSDHARERRFTCQILDGRYLARVYGPDLATAHARATAQYALLVRSR
ncbi:hypothetical protein JK358_21300 [Nocardia sp. 2]|uniref:Uncharacterized protein n=1 Tax=Nocardia acididurans TaxID=2802282 RepID=A0ABS1M8L5_9NOCA|nr:hypothetical protein [Nocardia acididurans]MBL1076936.1 hypothetical protein [Nocardia acididurans]